MADATREYIDEIEGARASVSAREVQAHVVRLGLSALSSKALVWAAALWGGAIWGYATMHVSEVLRIVTALGYSLAVFVPILIRDVRSR